MAGPGDEIAAAAAGGRGRLRATHADRERVIGTLKAAFVQGMLAKDEFDLRVGQTFAARTYAELAAVTADLPAGLSPARPSRAQRQQPVLPPGRVIAVATALYAVVWVYVPLSPAGGDNGVAGALVFLGALVYLGILLICTGSILASRRDKRSGGQPPRRPGVRGQASRRPPPAGPGGPLPPADHGHRHIAEAARSRRPRHRRPCAEAPLTAS
jgi:hypothetical protein